jgi:hypothetical protein
MPSKMALILNMAEFVRLVMQAILERKNNALNVVSLKVTLVVTVL